MSKKQTPLMEQYWSIKNAHMDKVLLFRMGDFFEMFHDDAVTAAPILNIALTSRNKKAEDETPMCGVPHHSIAGPIAKLLAAGFKVAICDQVEDPKLAKGIVKRAVTRILSPGMVYDPETIEQDRANYLCSFDKDSVAFLESSTGEAFYYLCKNDDEKRRLIEVYYPAEVLLKSIEQKQVFSFLSDYHCTELPSEARHLYQDIELPLAAKQLLSYAIYMQGEEIKNTLQSFERRDLQSQFVLSSTVIRHLEIFETYKGAKEGALFHAINRTKTSSGTRLLKRWLKFPLSSESLLKERLDQVESWSKDPARLKETRKVMGGMGDIERRLGKIANPNCGPRDILALGDSLLTGTLLTQLGSMDLDDELAQVVVKEIEERIEPETPQTFKTGGVIRRGYSCELDELIRYSDHSQQLLVEMEQKEKQQTGIHSLKIRYNNVFGYYIEVTKTHTDKVPDHYKRKQTLANAERYLTQELQELEDKILSARSRRVKLEEEIFADLRQSLLSKSAQLLNLAHLWAELDVLTSLAWLAIERNYCRPQFNQNKKILLKDSRHPVVEQSLNKKFVPNSLEMDQGHCLLLTVPNMAGKSTLMRQVALCSLLAQVGSYVPAKQAELPVFSQYFTRIGASDFLSEGLSTFMVEMKEAANMLAKANEDSLVILDEVGRGTSTFDGMSLAQAILEFLISKKESTVLFATHYHELTQLVRQYLQIHNAHMKIHEKSGDIEFLHTLAKGPANKSYGIEVAQLAGLPSSVTQRAKLILKQHESFGADSGQMSLLVQEQSESSVDATAQVWPEEFAQLVEQLKESTVQNMTPLEALNKIAAWKSLIN